MPSSATITAFYTFNAFTKARAYELNANFGNFRGHLIPIDTANASATDQTHDLGATDHYWRALYATSISLSMSMGTSQVMTGTPAGGFKFVNGATTTVTVLGSTFQALNATPMDMTDTALAGGFGASTPMNISITSNGAVSGWTCTITTVGRPVMIGLMNVGNTSGASGLFMRELTIGGITIPVGMKFIYMNGATTMGAQYFGMGRTGIGTTGYPNSWAYFQAGTMQQMIFPAAGTYKFFLVIDATTTSYTNIGFTLENVRLFAYELP